MKKQTITFAIIAIFLLNVAFASNFNGEITEISDPTLIIDAKVASPLESFLESVGVFAIMGMKTEYSPGSTASLTLYESLSKSCSATSVIEAYSSACQCSIGGDETSCENRGGKCNGHTASTYVGTAKKSLGVVGPMSVKTDLTYQIPVNAKLGTWSFSGYVVCANDPNPVPTYSTVDTPSFQVKAVVIPTNTYCGDKIIQQPNSAGVTEFCDGGSYICWSNNYVGSKACSSDCKGYSGTCVLKESCGDGIINGNEVCDKNTKQCMNSYTQMSCKSTCDGYDTSVCTAATSGTTTTTNTTTIVVGPNAGDSCTGDYPPANLKCTNGKLVEVPEGTVLIEPKVGDACTKDYLNVLKCVNGKYEGTSDTNIDPNAPNFKIDINEEDLLAAYKGSTNSKPSMITIPVTITNEGGEGNMKVETGIYFDKTLDDWGVKAMSVASANPVKNCKSYEENVKTYDVHLNKGESKKVNFDVKAPVAVGGVLGSVLGSTTDAYDIFADAYINCYSCGVETGQSDYDRKGIVLTMEAWADDKNSCRNGIVDSGIPNYETDTDCGGYCAEQNPVYACAPGYKCYDNSDCDANSICSGGNSFLKQKGVCQSQKDACDGKTPTLRPGADDADVLIPGEGTSGTDKTACPDPAGKTEAGVAYCIPNDCPYIDGELTVLGINFGKTTNQCCNSGIKKAVSTSDLSLKYPAMFAGAVGGGYFTAGTPIMAGGAAAGGGLGYVIGKYTFSKVDESGICQAPSAFGSLGQKYCEFIEGLGYDCQTATIVIIGLFVVILIFKK